MPRTSNHCSPPQARRSGLCIGIGLFLFRARATARPVRLRPAAAHQGGASVAGSSGELGGSAGGPRPAGRAKAVRRARHPRRARRARRARQLYHAVASHRAEPLPGSGRERVRGRAAATHPFSAPVTVGAAGKIQSLQDCGTRYRGGQHRYQRHDLPQRARSAAVFQCASGVHRGQRRGHLLHERRHE